MTLIETVVKGNAVRMRYADDGDATKATEWVEFEVSIGDMADPLLSELQIEALARVQTIIGPEMSRLKSLR